MSLFRVCSSLLLLLPFIKSSAQDKDYCFKQADSVLMSENAASILYKKLTALKNLFIPSRSDIRCDLNRDVDFGYRHWRFNVTLNLNKCQIDLLLRNDTIYAKVIRYYLIPFSNNTSARFHDTAMVGAFDYLNLRNKFYHSNKSISDLLNELSISKVYAHTCGIISSRTEESLYVEDLAKNKDVQKLFTMLQSICVETQAYGVSGFNMLKRQKVKIDAVTNQIVDHIIKRNSETITCSGCKSGLIEKIYSERK